MSRPPARHRAGGGAPSPRGRAARNAALAAAAALVLAAAVLLVVRAAGDAGPASRGRSGPGLAVYVQEEAGTRTLRPDEPLAPGTRLVAALEPRGHRYAAVALWQYEREPVILWTGEAREGPLPEAFAWDGGIGFAQVVAVYADAPIDAARLRAALAEGGPAQAGLHPGTRVVAVPLHRRR